MLVILLLCCITFWVSYIIILYIRLWGDCIQYTSVSCIDQQYVNLPWTCPETSKIHWLALPVLWCHSWCSQGALKLSQAFADYAIEFSIAADCTSNSEGAFRIVQYLTYRIQKFWTSGNLSAYLQETSRAAETTAQLCGRYWTWYCMLTEVIDRIS